MKATELRIGNWVHLDKKSIQLDVDEWHNYIHADFDEERYEPVEIDDYFLVGFAFSDNRKIIRTNIGIAIIELYHWGDDNSYDISINGNLIRNIKYVHELQNVIFALNGIELKFKMTEEKFAKL